VATILIVDDLAAHRFLLLTILGDQGHRLLEAANGSEALVVVRAERPDLVITDVMMPVMDGYEFVRQLRLDPANSGIPVLFYTARYGAGEARALALASGMPYIIPKPAAAPDVLRIVAQVLSGEVEMRRPPEPDLVLEEPDREQLELLTYRPAEEAGDLRTANARLRAVINIGLDLASKRDSDQLLQTVCADARDLFGATYSTLGIVDPSDRTAQRFVTCGTVCEAWIRAGDSVPGILGTVVASRRTLRGENPGGDPANLQLPLRHPIIQAFLAAPIASPSHVYGWICLVGNEGRVFTEEDEHLLMALSGQVGRIYEVEHEIVERKQAELALREERDRSQRYLDTAEVILLKLDVAGRIKLVNRYACSVLGWTSDELIGRDFIETCVPAGIRDATRRKLGAVLAGPESSRVDNAIVTRSGEERMVEWRNILLRDAEGHLVGTLSSGTDITERISALEAVRTAEERMRFALEAAGVGTWDQDYTAGTLVWSETIQAQYGIQPGTFGGTFEAFVERVHPEDRESLLATFGKAMKSGGDFVTENRAIWPDGTVRWLRGSGRIHVGKQGEPLRAVGISLDVTDRRSLEAQYHQAQKMEAIGRLAGGVAHDFNNLLTVILGYCEMLLSDLDPDDVRQQDIAAIQKAGLSAAGLTRQLLAFSRKEIIEPTLLDLNVVMAEMRPLIVRLIGENVKVVLRQEPELAVVKADRGHMEQIVMNLAVNARDAMPQGGTLTIKTDNVELDEDYAKMHFGVKPGFYAALTVSDTGTGMTPEVQGRLFEPFFTTKELGKGTGLGLATVHGIVARSGGSISVYSEIGRGTTFKVYLPRADATELAVAAAPPPARPNAGAQTVLVVEDAEGLRELTKRVLERQGYTVLVAGNADEAVRLFEAGATVDVLLTDVVMPGASGPELTKRLKIKRPELKVVYMSGYTQDAIVQHGVLNPGIAFLHKPFTSDALGRKLREVLDRPAELPQVALYRLRDGKHATDCLPGELYRLLQEDRTPGYVFLEVEGKPKCVWAADFERAEPVAATQSHP
jgi:two-component system cell cycle sensor histidine kinase/response regulator CckA